MFSYVSDKASPKEKLICVEHLYEMEGYILDAINFKLLHGNPYKSLIHMCQKVQDSVHNREFNAKRIRCNETHHEEDKEEGEELAVLTGAGTIDKQNVQSDCVGFKLLQESWKIINDTYIYLTNIHFHFPQDIIALAAMTIAAIRINHPIRNNINNKNDNNDRCGRKQQYEFHANDKVFDEALSHWINTGKVDANLLCDAITIISDMYVELEAEDIPNIVSCITSERADRTLAQMTIIYHKALYNSCTTV